MKIALCRPCKRYRLYGKVQKRKVRRVVRPMDVECAQGTRVVSIKKFLSNTEIQCVLDIVHNSNLTAYTSNYNEDTDNRGNAVHTTTYLQTRGLFRKRLRWLEDRLRTLVKSVSVQERWGFKLQNCPFFNVRVAEYHDMYAGGSLPFPKHYDIGSLITVDIMLKEALGGGQFQTLECINEQVDGTIQEALKSHIFEVGDALVFVSHKYHSVSPVAHGNRKVLVVEFWQGKRRHCGHRCDKQMGICSFRD